MKQLALDLTRRPAPTLDNFVPGANQEVLAVLRALAQGAAADRFVYLWAGRGCGKTHLLRACVAAAQARGLRARLLEPGWEKHAVAGYDLLALDDVLALSEGAQQALFNLINRLQAGSGALLVSGPYAPMHLRLRADLASRLGQGLVFQVKCLSDAEKIDALIAQAQGRGLDLPREVPAYLLKTWRRDLPALLAVLDVLDRYALETKRAITVPLAREVLSCLPADGRA